MKKLFTLTIFLLFIAPAFACDICGCSSGNYFLGPFPQFKRHFFGVRYSIRSYESRVAADGEEFSKDFYQSAELWGGWNMSKKWQLLAFVPYNINKQTSDDGTRITNGLGDVSFIVNHKIIDERHTGKSGNRISQQLWIGGGAKLPTGKFSPDELDIIPDANNQAGTGSLDFILNTMYTIHINDWGINSDVNYKINQSAKDFRFGNRLNATAFAFRSFANKTGTTTFNPNAGLMYEHLDANTLTTAKIVNTGGDALLAAAGLEVNFATMAVGVNAQVPITQNLSNHQTKTNMQGMVHVSFLF